MTIETTEILTFGLLIVTGIYAWLTHRIAQAMNHPEIMIAIRPSEVYYQKSKLCIKNVGTGIAYNVRFKGDTCANIGDSGYGKDTKLKDINLIGNGINALGPGEEVSHTFWYMQKEIEAKLIKNPIILIATYKGSTYKWKKQKRKFTLDFSEFYNTAADRLAKSPIEKIAATLNEIKMQLTLPKYNNKPIFITESLSDHELRHAADKLNRESINNRKAYDAKITEFPPDVQKEILEEVNELYRKRVNNYMNQSTND